MGWCEGYQIYFILAYLAFIVQIEFQHLMSELRFRLQIKVGLFFI